MKDANLINCYVFISYRVKEYYILITSNENGMKTVIV